MASDKKKQENITQIQQGLRSSLRSWLGSWQEWGSVIFLFLALEIAVRSIEQAEWITPQPSLTFILTLAVLAGLLLVKSRLPDIATYLLAVVLGAIVTVWQASNLLPQLEMASGVNHFIVALIVTKPNESTIHFATFLISFTWIMGYVSTWFILRRQNAWVAVSLGAITILVNLSNLTAKDYGFFFFYLVAAMLLVAQTKLTRRYYWFKKHGVNYPNRGMIYFVTSVLCLSLLTVSIAWRIPEVRVNQLETMISTKIWRKNLEDYWLNLFAAVPAKHPSLQSREQKELLFGGSFDLSNKVLFVITSEQPSYWRTQVYDIYTSQGWMSSPVTEHELEQGVPRAEAEEFSNRYQLTYSVVTNLKTDILLTAGEFVSSDTPALLHTLALPSFDVYVISPFESLPLEFDAFLPPDVWSLTLTLIRATRAQGKVPSLTEIRQLLPEDLILTSIGKDHYPSTEANYQLISDSGQLKTIEVTRVPTGARDVIAVTMPNFLMPKQRYTATASITSATPDDLSKAGEDYPRQITDYYLQLPYTLPQTVRQLSMAITKEAESPYEKVLAIKGHLSQIPYNYNAEAEAPPPRSDGVEHFLFTQQSGDCVYFASAMAVMLRYVHVPSRLCTGYLPGERDSASGSFIIRAKDYHAWVEVYFPDYGWVPFEATPVTESEKGGSGGGEGAIDEFIEDEGVDVTGVAKTAKWFGLTLFFTFVGLIFLGLTVWSAYHYWLRVFIGQNHASKVYARMCFFASLVRLSPRPQQTPLEYCAKLTSVFPLQAEAIGNITQTYQESRFARRKELAAQQKGRLLQSWRDVYHVLLKRLFHVG